MGRRYPYDRNQSTLIMTKAKVTVKVEPHPNRKGYQLKHNQPNEFKGCPASGFGWYKYKGMADIRAKELETNWNLKTNEP